MADPTLTQDTLVTRPSLLIRLGDSDDHISWEEFYRRYRPPVFGLARKAGLNEQDAEEVVNDVFKRVAETIQTFESDPKRGTFKSWLFTLTRWRITDKFRSQGSAQAMQAPADESRTAVIERLPDTSDLESAIEDEWRRSLLSQAMERVRQDSDPVHFQALEMLNAGKDAQAVADALGMRRAAVYVVSHRLTQRLKAEVARLQATLG